MRPTTERPGSGSTPSADLIGLVRVVADGHTVLSPAAGRRLIAACTDRQPAREHARKLVGTLTSERLRCSAASVRDCRIPR